VVTVRESGRWYVSALLSYGEFIRTNGFSASEDFPLGTLSPEVERYSDPVAAAMGTASGLAAWAATGDVHELAKTAPLAERRFLDLYGGMFGSVPWPTAGVVVERADFTQLETVGDQARVRVDRLDLTLMDDSPMAASVQDGTCLTVSDVVEKTCLQDILNVSSMRRIFQTVVSSYFQLWSPGLAGSGVNGTIVFDRLQTLAEAAVGAIEFDKVGLVALHEGDGWHVSLFASQAELGRLLEKAVAVGLKATAVR
jgi:hypothetical protein